MVIEEQKNEVYEYFEMELTPTIIEELCKKLYAGKVMKREEIIKQISKFHINKGGLKSKVQDVTSQFKKALSNLKEEGAVENPVRGGGVWRFISNDTIDNEDTSSQKDEEIIMQEELFDDEIELAEFVVGTGDSKVYMYYYETYKTHAIQNGCNIWQCKIGRTDRNPLERVLSQAATALPEKPHISIIIQTNQANELENALHSILKLRKRYLSDAPGNEWFSTSPEEILNILEYIGVS